MNEISADEVLRSNYYIDYTVDEINIIASVLMSEIEDQGLSSKENLMEAKKVLNTILFTLTSKKDWCDEVLSVYSELSEQIKLQADDTIQS